MQDQQQQQQEEERRRRRRRPTPRGVSGASMRSSVVSLLSAPYASFTRTQRGETRGAAAPEIVELLDMADHTAQLNCCVPVHEPLFEATPPSILFEEYEPFVEQKVTIELRNKDKYARRVRVEPPESHHFRLSAPKRAEHRVAPGMSLTYTLSFLPDKEAAYSCNLMVVTEREKFLLPVKAVGVVAEVELPSSVTFPAAPVAFPSQHPLLLRNLGRSAVEFVMRTNEPAFAVAPLEGTLAAGAVLQATVSFCPDRRGQFVDTLLVELGDAQRVEVELAGAAFDVDVNLDVHHLNLDPTYIDLVSKGSVRLVNRSDIPIHFQWCGFANAAEEAAYVDARLEEIEDEERAERNRVSTLLEEGDDVVLEDDDDSASSSSDEEDSRELKTMRANHAVTRKFRKRRVALDEEVHVFQNEFFRISPLSGEVYPGGFVEVLVEFCPHEATEYNVTAFCQTSGRSERLALHMKGEGRGPKAAFSYEYLDVGDVFVGAVHEYSIVLQNIGDIPVTYERLHHGRSRFEFEPDVGTLAVMPEEADMAHAGDSQVQMKVTFHSERVGEFKEVIEWRLKGTIAPLKVAYRGRVVPPSFHFDVDELRYKKVSYGFTNTRDLTLFNTSEVPIQFRVRVPQDEKRTADLCVRYEEELEEDDMRTRGGGARMLNSRQQQQQPAPRPTPEFVITTPSDVVMPGESVPVRVEFTSVTKQSYEYSLVVDVIGVADALLSLPITASCLVPDLALVSADVEFGPAFLNYENTQIVELSNTSDLPVRFRVLPQDESTLCVGIIRAEHEMGVVEPDSIYELPVHLNPQCLGQIEIPFLIDVCGGDDDPLMLTARATSVGPTVSVDRTALDFGHVDVLRDVTRSVTVTNSSPIVADVKTFVHTKNSSFRVSAIEGQIPPNSSVELDVVVHLNDTAKFVDTLHIVVQNGDAFTVRLKAVGQGNTLTIWEEDDEEEEADEEKEEKDEEKKEKLPLDLSTLDLGDVFTRTKIERRFVVQNDGRRRATLTWRYEPPKLSKEEQKRKALAEEERALRRKKKLSKEEEIEAGHPFFDVTPEKATLEPDTCMLFTLSGSCDLSAAIEEVWQCNVTLGSDRRGSVAFQSLVKANFVVPLLELEPSWLHFSYTYSPEQEGALQSRPVTVTNLSALPLVYWLRCDPPFSVDQLEMELAPHETAQLHVSFAANMKTDRQSANLKSNMLITYRDHHQRDRFPLFGEITFPNVEFSTDVVDFGCFVNDTSKRVVVTMRNVSDVPAVYAWAFLEDGPSDMKWPSRPASPISRRASSRPSARRDSSNRLLELPAGTTTAAPAATEKAGDSTSTTTTGRKRRKSKAKASPAPQLPATEVFDILPIRGCLAPGESEEVEFLMYGHRNHRARITAVCEIEGGPAYELTLKGESATSAFTISQEHVDFPPCQLGQTQSHQIVLHNTGRVDLDFAVDQSKLTDTSPPVFRVVPDSGTLLHGKKATLTVYHKCRLPDMFQEHVFLKVGHFNAVPIGITARGVYPQVRVSLPRATAPDEWEALLEEADATMQATREFEALQEVEWTRREQQRVEALRANPNAVLRSRASSRASSRDNLTVASSRRPGSARSMRSTASVREQRLLESLVPRPYEPLPDVYYDRELEADRLRFMREVRKTLKRRASAEPEATSRSITKGGTGGAAAGAVELNVSSDFSIAEHGLDFGNVVFNTRTKRVFRVQNAGEMPVALEISKTALARSVFSVEPSRVGRLPPGATQEFTVVVETKKRRHEPHLAEVTVPMTVRNAPSVNITFRANVTVPRLELSESRLNMGDVYAGQRREAFVLLENPSEVACEWYTREIGPGTGKGPAHKATASDVRAFECSPTAGTLAPGASTHVRVAFAPEAAPHKYVAHVPFLIKMSNKIQNLVLSGSGLRKSLAFDPPLAELAPALPNVKGASVGVSLVNESDVPVEVFSVEFDTQHTFEDEIVAAVAALPPEENPFVDGTLFSDVREPAQPLPAVILDIYRRLVVHKGDEQLAEDEEVKEEEWEDETKQQTEEKEEEKKEEEEKRAPRHVCVAGGPFSDEAAVVEAAVSALECKRALTLDDVVAFFVEERAGADAALAAEARTAMAEDGGVSANLLSRLLASYLAPATTASIRYDSDGGGPDTDESQKLPPGFVAPVDYRALLEAGDRAADEADEAAGSSSRGRVRPSVVLAGLRCASLLPEELEDEDMNNSRTPALLAHALACARVVHETFQRLRGDAERGLNDSNLEVLVVAADAETATARLEARLAELRALVADEETEKALKKFKPLDEKQLKKLERKPDKLAAYESKLAMHEAREQARAEFEDLEAHGAQRIADSYGGGETPLARVRACVDDDELTRVYAARGPDDVAEALHEHVFAYREPPVDPRAVPPPRTLQVVHALRALAKGGKRAKSAASAGPAHFFIEPSSRLPPEEDEKEEENNNDDEDEQEKKKKKRMSKKVTKAMLAEAEAAAERKRVEEERRAREPLAPRVTRWVVPARGRLEEAFRVAFVADAPGAVSETLRFTIVGAPASAATFALPCRGVCGLPQVSTDPRSVFMKRVKTRRANAPVSRQFVADEGRFDFGPLLISKDAAEQKAHADTNSTVLRLANTSLFPVRATLAFRYGGTGMSPERVAEAKAREEAEAEADKKKSRRRTGKPGSATKDRTKKSKQKKEPGDGATVFTVDVETVEIPVDAVREVTVWAFPRVSGEFEDELVCTIADNPEPAVFRFRAEGAEPRVSASATELEFGRLLCGQANVQTVMLTNESCVPARWQLGDMAALPGEFAVSPGAEGVLPPFAQTPLTIRFRGDEQVVHKVSLTLTVSDTEGVEEATHTVPLSLTAEAFKFDAEVKFPEEGVDLGSVLVGERAEQKFPIANRGKYPIRVRFSPHGASSALAGVVSVAPQEFSVATGKSADVTVTFDATREAHIDQNADIKAFLIEEKTGETIETVPVIVSAHSFYSEFRLLPLHGINFGPMERGSTRTKKCEIFNDGHFEFDFAVVAAGGASDGRSSSSRRKARRATSTKSSSKKGKKGGSGGSLSVGAYTVTPAAGTVAPGTSAVIEVTVDASELKNAFSETVLFDITHRDPTNPLRGQLSAHSSASLLMKQVDREGRIVYELAGEACSPGIETSDWRCVFEEQDIVEHASAKTHGNFFATAERAFYFAPVVIQQDASEVGEDEERKAAAQHHVVERFRVQNPFKVACDVTVRAVDVSEGELKDDSKKGKKKKSSKKTADDGAADGSGSGAFRVSPTAFHLASQEHCFVSVQFCPSELRSYAARFEATVANGGDPKTERLFFTLKGDGTLPHLSVAQPVARDARNRPLVTFPRVLCSGERAQQVTAPLVLRNDGIVLATARFDLVGEDADVFSFSGQGTLVTLDPGAARDMAVAFTPDRPGAFRAELVMKVLHNAFEVTSIALEGVGFSKDVALEGAEGEPPLVQLGDVLPGTPAQRLLTMVNRSDAVYRFVWQYGRAEEAAGTGIDDVRPSTHPCLSVSPCVGHIPPHSAKIVCVELYSEEPVALTAERVACSLQRIEVKAADDGEEAEDWDSSRTNVRRVTRRELREAAQAAAAAAEKEQKSSNKKKGGKKGSKKQQKREEVEEEEKKDEALDLDNEDDGDELVEVSDAVPEPAFHALEPLLPFAGGAGDAKKKKKKKAKQQEDEDEESELDDRQLVVRVDGVVGVGEYACEVKELAFRQTMMFQSRTSTLSVANTGAVGLPFAWRAEAPFVVEPASGEIPPGESLDFVVKFSPDDALSFATQLVCELPTAAPAQRELRVRASGTSGRPKCHFELEPSDYLVSGRRDAELPGPFGRVGPLEPGYRVIEFQSLGVKVRNTQRFYALNPTNTAYSFSWECENAAAASSSKKNPFRCLTPKGVIAPGKKFEMAFDYTPRETALAESFWRFRIQDFATDLEVPVLLVGAVAEPDVSLSTTHVNFNALKVGARAKQVVQLTNAEHIPFAFAVDTSVLAEGDGAFSIAPASGVVGPHDSVALTVRFRPHGEEKSNVNVPIVVKKKPMPLSLNIKGEGFLLKPVLEVEEKDASSGEVRSRELLALQANRIAFGDVHVKEKRSQTVHVRNRGKFGFDFQWRVPANRFVSVAPESGFVRAGEAAACSVSFHSTSERGVDALPLVCTIGNALDFDVLVSGRGKRPTLDFSFTDVDFGPSFVHEVTTEAAICRRELRIVNRERSENVAIDAMYEGSALISRGGHLEVQATPTVLAAGETLSVPILFCPRETRKYKETIAFEVNGLYTVVVSVTGQGVPLRLELDEASASGVTFGALRVGQRTTQSVRIVNRSKKTASFRLRRDPAAVGGDSLLHRYVMARPSLGQAVSVRPREAISFDFTFTPIEPTPEFTEQLFIEAEGTAARPLFAVTGSCHGVGLHLGMQAVPFGAVVLHSAVTKKVAVENVGDVPLRYTWQLSPAVLRDFTIAPAEGVVPPHGTVSLDITFHPTHVSSDIRYDDIVARIEGASVPDVGLTLTGECIPQPREEAQELKFQCRVRQSTTQKVTVKNPTDQPWQLRPIIENASWSGAPALAVPAKSSASYEVLFEPLTRNGGTHEGSLFFPLPGGKALMFRLVGAVGEPVSEGAVEAKVSAKETSVHTLDVCNWLKEYQRFHVEIDRGGDATPGVRIEGSDTIDVPPGLTRKFKLSFSALKEGTHNATVRFVNRQSGEFLFYTMSFVVGPMTPDESVPLLKAPARQRVVHALHIGNPLDVDATVSGFQCADEDVFVKLPVRVPARSEAIVEVQYRPLVPRERDERKELLTLSSAELGDFRYLLRSVALPVGVESSLRFQASLGTAVSQTFRFTSFAATPTKFTCEIKGSEFAAASAVVQAPAAERGSDGVEVEVDVTYEPSFLGDARDELVVVAGEQVYRCALRGHCTAPKPQGPLVVRAGGGGASIPFKNVLDVAETYAFAVDNTAAFAVNRSSDKINAKAVVSVGVTFKGDRPAAGKLLITCKRLKGVAWVVYLRGQQK